MSDTTIDVDTAPSAVAVRPGIAVGQALGVGEILAQVALIQSVMHQVMKEGEHFGAIPGCGNKKTLLQPGAQKLTMTFRLCPEYTIQESNLDRGHKEYRIICTLKSMGSGGFVGQGVGCCSTMESKYRWRGGARKCSKCGAEAIIKGRSEYGGGWLCFAKKGGCGAKWPDGAQEIESQSVEKVEHDNPADHYNTVLKMAKKRAFVDATITATAASDIFTQDIGDESAPVEDDPQQSAKIDTPTLQNAPAAPPAPARPIPAVPPFPTPAFRARMIEELSECPESSQEYMETVGWLMENERLADLPLRWVPNSEAQMKALRDRITDFANGNDAETPYPAHPEPNAKESKAMETAAAALLLRPEDESWYNIIVPIPHKGQTRSDYLRTPDTIGSLYAARKDNEEARKRLWGFVAHYEPKSWVGKDGITRPPGAADVAFKAALDQFGAWFKQNHAKETL